MKTGDLLIIGGLAIAGWAAYKIVTKTQEGVDEVLATPGNIIKSITDPVSQAAQQTGQVITNSAGNLLNAIGENAMELERQSVNLTQSANLAFQNTYKTVSYFAVNPDGLVDSQPTYLEDGSIAYFNDVSQHVLYDVRGPNPTAVASFATWAELNKNNDASDQNASFVSRDKLGY